MSDRTAPTAWIKAASDDHLRDIRDETESAMVSIRSQIDSAKAEWAAKRTQTDYRWLISAQNALRRKGLLHQPVPRELALRDRAARNENQTTVERRFVDIARRRLDPVLFRELMTEANA